MKVKAGRSPAVRLAIQQLADAFAQDVLLEPAFREELKGLARDIVRDSHGLPAIMTLQELATFYRLSAATIRSQVQRGTFAPRPWAKYPYRWRREDVIADLKRDRPERPRKPHGFATTRLGPADT